MFVRRGLRFKADGRHSRLEVLHLCLLAGARR